LSKHTLGFWGGGGEGWGGGGQASCFLNKARPVKEITHPRERLHWVKKTKVKNQKRKWRRKKRPKNDGSSSLLLGVKRCGKLPTLLVYQWQEERENAWRMGQKKEKKKRPTEGRTKVKSTFPFEQVLS